MRRLLAASALLCLMWVGGTAHAGNTLRDGNWWLTLPQTTKLGYATGLFEGMILGGRFSIWAIVGGGISDAGRECMSNFGFYSSKYVGNMSSSQIASGLDAFYADYRNRAIGTENAVWVVLNEIAGNSTQEMTTNFRR